MLKLWQVFIKLMWIDFLEALPQGPKSDWEQPKVVFLWIFLWKVTDVSEWSSQGFLLAVGTY